MLEVTTAPRRRSPIVVPGYRAGMAPLNKGKTYPTEVLTRAEVHRILAACSRHGNAGIRNRALITVLYRSGLRIAEALALLPKDVDFEIGAITVLHGKGDQRRTVGIDDPALAVLAQWMTRRRELGINGRAPVFCVISRQNLGAPMYSSYVRDALKKLAVAAGVEKRVHPHGLRHTHASEIARDGLPLHVIRRQLGHNDLRVTALYIDHLTPWAVVDAIRERPDWTEANQHAGAP
jgi:site-specific recombinase XerD